MGNSLPVISDGVTKFKAQIGAEPYLRGIHRGDSFYFLPMSASLPMISLLKSNPLYFLWEEGLRSLFFLEASEFDSKEEFLNFCGKQSPPKGIPMEILCFDSPEKLIGWLEPNKNGKIKIHKFTEDFLMDEIHPVKPWSEASHV